MQACFYWSLWCYILFNAIFFFFAVVVFDARWAELATSTDVHYDVLLQVWKMGQIYCTVLLKCSLKWTFRTSNNNLCKTKNNNVKTSVFNEIKFYVSKNSRFNQTKFFGTSPMSSYKSFVFALLFLNTTSLDFHLVPKSL